MDGGILKESKDQGRGIVGALLVGTPLLFTMETWWRAERISTWTLLAFALAGLVAIIAILRVVGFRQEDSGLNTIRDGVEQLADLVLQSVVAALVVLFTFGIVQWGDAPIVVARMVLIQLVPLGLGAAVANEVLRESKAGKAQRLPFPKNVGIFAIGAIFFSLQIAPTEETALMAALASWWRLAAGIVLSLLVVYLALYELEFRGHGKRTSGRSKAEHVGQAFLVYATALLISALLLAGYGSLNGETFAVSVQRTIILSFPAAVGGAIAEVGLG